MSVWNKVNIGINVGEVDYSAGAAAMASTVINTGTFTFRQVRREYKQTLRQTGMHAAIFPPRPLMDLT